LLSEGNNCEKGIIIRREFRGINDFILQNWGACVDTIFGHVSGKINEAWIGRLKSDDWSTRKLSMAYDTDDKATGYD